MTSRELAVAVEVEGLVPWTWWPHEEVGHTDEAKKILADARRQLYKILAEDEPEDRPEA